MPCGPHARAHVEFLPNPSVSQRAQHKHLQNPVVLQPKIFNCSSRAFAKSNENPYVSNLPVPGGHAGRSRAHVEVIRCTNPYHLIPCRPHARAHVGILPKPSVPQRFQQKTFRNQLFLNRESLIVNRARAYETKAFLSREATRAARAPTSNVPVARIPIT